MTNQDQDRRKTGPKAAVALAAGVLIATLVLSSDRSLLAMVLKEPVRALETQFPGASIRRTAVYLKPEERADLERQLGFRLEGRFHTFYVATRAGQTLGYATFDTHRVRTKEETLFVVIAPDGSVRHVEVISFFEPQEYLAPPRWLQLFQGRRDGLQPGVDLPAISGATMTTHAVARTVRKVLLLSRVHFGS